MTAELRTDAGELLYTDDGYQLYAIQVGTPVIGLPLAVYVNNTWSPGGQNLDATGKGDVRVRVRVSAIVGSMVVSMSGPKMSSSFAISAPGDYEVGVWHSAVSGTVAIAPTVALTGTATYTCEMFAVAAGEEVPDWES